MRLRRVEIENFRLIERLSVDLHPRMNVLIGANAAGKTTVLEAVAFSLDHVLVATGHTPENSFAASDLCRRARDADGEIRVHLHSDEALSVRVTVKGGTAKVSPKGVRQKLASAEPLPLAAYYGTERLAPRTPNPTEEVDTPDGVRVDAWLGAFTPRLSFAHFKDWFERQSVAESLEHSRLKRFDVESIPLKAVRDAVRAMIPGCRDLRLAGNPPRIQATMDRGDGSTEDVDFTEMSDGYRTLLAVVADIARRMVQANPHQGLQSQALVMIDEIDLHLHPKWQQIVLASLLTAFPNAQFLVTTHSPQIIATAEPEHLICLVRDGDRLEAVRPESTYGALPERILEDVMGLPHARPPDVAQKLGRYQELIALDQGEGEEALGLRAWLNERFRGQEPELVRADLEIRRRKLTRSRSA